MNCGSKMQLFVAVGNTRKKSPTRLYQLCFAKVAGELVHLYVVLLLLLALRMALLAMMFRYHFCIPVCC